MTGRGGAGASAPGSIGPRRSRRRGLTLTAPLLVAAVLSLASLAAIVGLTRHANNSRDAQITLDDIQVDVNQLQNMPWRLQSFRGLSAQTLSAEIAGKERGLSHTLTALRTRSPIRGLNPITPLLRRNFDLLSEQLGLLARNNTTAASKLEPARFDSQDAILRALDRADATYHAQTTTSLIEATVGSAVVVLLLLSAFGVFFRRALVARQAAEALSERLRENEAHLEQAQRIAMLGSWEWDASTTTFRCSAEHARLHGWEHDQLSSGIDALLEAVDPEDRARLTHALGEARINGGRASVEYRVTADADARLLHLEATAVKDARGVTLLIGTCQDVTDRFRRAEAEQANQAKSEFISRMSHELRTPLNAILGFGQLLRTAELDERQSANVERIIAAGGHLLDLINEILDISGIESGRLHLSPEPVRVADVINDAIDLVTPIASARSIEITAEHPSREAWAKADVQRLKQVLLNLLSNAIKYNRDGGHVEVRTRRQGDRVQIVVQDDGPGIAPPMLDRLFEPFDRLGAEHTTVEGTGLGLALSKGMIEAMGGTITAHSQAGAGAGFTLDLAIAPAQPHGAIAGPHPAAAHAPTGAHATASTHDVLCIEDDPSNLTLINQIFARRPRIELLSAGQGTLGIELAQEHRPALILLDLHLPDIPGTEILARLRADPTTRDIPVVVLSADATADQLKRLAEGGARDYLTKPLDIRRLLAVVDATLSPSLPEAA